MKDSTIAKAGRSSRRARVAVSTGGVWASSSQDFVRVATLLIEQSADYARSHDGNVSIYVLPGIPMLFSALRCLLIELQAGMHTNMLPNAAKLTQLDGSRNEIAFIVETYAVPADLVRDLELLLEVRHEIVHPAHRPAGGPTNTPDYLAILRDQDLLQSTRLSTHDYSWLSQLQSHRLFVWAFRTIERTVVVLLEHHAVQHRVPVTLLDSYRAYQQWVAP